MLETFLLHLLSEMRRTEEEEGRMLGDGAHTILVLGNNLWYIRDYIIYCSIVVLGI